jgi:serine/threonine protein phosphatase 1
MVLRRIFKRGAPFASNPKVPDGQRVYAVGDIHGRLDCLDDLIGQIRRDDHDRGPADTHLVFLGDLVDRGPDSRLVVDRLIELAASGIRMTVLKGNHEEVFLRAAGGDVKATRFLTRIGGKQTVLSYGVSKEAYEACDFDELTGLLASNVPLEHLQFMESFEDHVRVGDYLFVHAGLRPGVPLGEQSPADLRWIRAEFLDSSIDHGLVVIHGHSIADEVQVRANRIGIDTGAFATGRLTAIGLEGDSRWFLST